MSLMRGDQSRMKPDATDLEQSVRSALGAALRPGIHMIGGPAVAIDARASAVLMHVLREHLIDSAAGDTDGRDCGVTIAWSCDDQGSCVIELNEIGEALPPTQLNGLNLPPFEQSSVFQQAGNGMVQFELSDRGARIIVPARYITGANDNRPIGPAAISSDPLAGRSVLVVEDQLIIALDLEMLLREQGAVDVQLCGSAEEALKCIASEQPDIAILDVNLGSTTSFPVAGELQRLGVPFIFATGYGNEVEFPREMRSVPLVGKPYCIDTMREALRTSCVAHA